MYNRLYIILIILVFVGVFSSPFWINKDTPLYQYPCCIIPQGKERNTCIESNAWMQANHMNLLDEWRDEATRNGNNIYISSNNREWLISLQNTCMGCHTNKQAFCDRCHNSNNVHPYCWSCHVAPERSY